MVSKILPEKPFEVDMYVTPKQGSLPIFSLVASSPHRIDHQGEFTVKRVWWFQKFWAVDLREIKGTYPAGSFIKVN